MATCKTAILAASVALLASGCLFAGDTKWPTLQMPPENAAPATAASETPAPPSAPGAAELSAEEIGKTLDSVAARLDLHQNDAASVGALIADQRERYETARDAAAGGGTGEVQNDRWSTAQVELSRLAADVERLSDLEEALAGDAGRLSELYASSRSGGTSQNADKAGSLIARAGALLSSVRADRAEGERYVEEQRTRLASLRPDAPLAAGPSLPRDRDAYVVFHMDRDDAGSEDALRDAVSTALARKPDLMFDLYTVTGSAGDDLKAQDRAQDMARIIRSMNVPEDRVSLTNIRLPEATPPEVRIYLR
jgi:hypothetical protein